MKRHPHVAIPRRLRAGSGSSGQVFLCLNQKTGRLMAVKEVPFDPTDTQRRQRVQTEITLLRCVASDAVCAWPAPWRTLIHAV